MGLFEYGGILKNKETSEMTRVHTNKNWLYVLIALTLAACQIDAPERIVLTPTGGISPSYTSTQDEILSRKTTLSKPSTNPSSLSETPSSRVTMDPTFQSPSTQTPRPTITQTPTITPTPLPEELILWNFTVPEGELGSWCESSNVGSKLDLWAQSLADDFLDKTKYTFIEYDLIGSFQDLPLGVDVSNHPDQNVSCITINQSLSPGEKFSRIEIILDIDNLSDSEEPEDTAYIHFNVLPGMNTEDNQPLIAYSSSVYSFFTGAIIGELPPQLYGSNIFVQSPGGSMLTNLTNEPPNEFASGWDYPAWAPDGKELAIVYQVAGISRGIYTISVDGSGLTQITENGLFPAWSPAGKQIAFVYAGIWRINTDGSGLTQLTQDAGDIIKWSSDGTRIAYTSGGNIWITNSDGSFQTQLTQEGGESPNWSPDNSKIAYVFMNDIWVMNSDGSGKRQVVKTGDISSSPAWSPDESRIAFISGGQVYTVLENGSGLSPMTPVRMLANQVSWSPDGEKLLFNSPWDIYVMNADGSGIINLSLNDFTIEGWASWQPIP